MVRNVYQSNLPVHIFKMVIENYTSKKVGIKSLTMKSTSKFLQSKILTIKCSGYSGV